MFKALRKTFANFAVKNFAVKKHSSKTQNIHCLFRLLFCPVQLIIAILFSAFDALLSR